MTNVDTSVFPGALDTEKFFLPALNNVKTTLTVSVTPNQVSVVNVVTTSGFPDEGVISIDKEVIYYRTKTLTSFKNITRGYDGTTSVQHVSGADVELRWVAAHHNRLKNAVKSIERTLGVNPQGAYPTVAQRLDSIFNGVNKRTSQILLQSDATTETETGYIGGASRLARMFVCSERFIKIPDYGPVVYLDGLAQIQNDPVFLVDNVPLTSIDVNDGLSKGVIVCNSALFITNGVSVGDLVVVKGSPTNNDAYIVDTVLSETQIKVTEVIFGVDQLSGAIGSVSIIDINGASPVKDVVCLPILFVSAEEADAVIFLNPPEVLQFVRMDYEVKNAAVTVTYSDPIAVLADYENPTNSGSIASLGTDTFTLAIGRDRAFIFKVKLLSTSSPESTNVTIEVFGKSDFTELQYKSEYIDLSLGEYVDNIVWHYHNKDAVTTTNLYVRITDIAGQSFTYTFVIEVEAIGNNI
jgi:hypothetical protein